MFQIGVISKSIADIGIHDVIRDCAFVLSGVRFLVLVTSFGDTGNANVQAQFRLFVSNGWKQFLCFSSFHAPFIRVEVFC